MFHIFLLYRWPGQLVICKEMSARKCIRAFYICTMNMQL